jgi:para-aminobenzoate synthetase component 1
MISSDNLQFLYFHRMIQRINQLAVNRIPFLLIVDFEMQHPLLYPLDDLPPDIRFSTPAYKTPEQQHAPLPGRVKFQSTPVPFSRYSEAFRIILENARAGKTYLANLTFPSKLSTNLSLQQIHAFSRARYKLLFKNEFVVFSPETFVRIREGRIYSYPMKGTLDASLPGARVQLLNDRKEMAEHVTIVDLIRNDLSIHARDVRVEQFRYVDTLETNRKRLLQVSSRISGRLPEDYHARLGEILFSMLPAGSVSGAPKEETLRIIRASEGGPRGYYCGIMGHFDGRDFDSGVLIRFIERREDGLVYRSGGGITFMSDPEKEYQELIDKVYVPLA